MNKELYKILQLSETATNDDMMNTIKSLIESSKKMSELTKTLEEMTTENKELKENYEEKEEELKTMKEKEEEVKEDNVKMSEKIKDIEAKLLHSDWEKVSSIALSEGKLTQKMLSVYEKSFKANPEATKEMMKVLEPVVNLSEKGSSKSNDDKSNTDLFNDEVTKYMSENKVDYTQAIVAVEKNNPQLFKLFDNERRGV